MTFNIEASDYHRNGVGGEGFYIAIVRDDEEDGRRFLVIDFTGAQDAENREYGYTAVVDVDEAARGNISMHPEHDESGAPIPNTGGNAWRGDALGDRYREAIQAHRQADYDRPVASIKAQNEANR